MHPVDLFIIIGIACMVGFTPLIYVRHDLLLAFGYIVLSTVGAFAGAYVALWYFPQTDKPGIIFGGFAGAIIPVAVWHFVRRRGDRK